MQNLCHDVRYGLWMLAKNPGFTAIDAAWSDAGAGDCVVVGVLDTGAQGYASRSFSGAAR
jgi:hypothetical protein